MGDRLTTQQAVQAVGRPVFTTREIAALRRGSLSASSQALRRMERQGLLAQPARGLWCVPTDPRFSLFSLVPPLAGGHRAYVSLLTALHLHGLIEQIPQVVYAVTTGHTRTVQTWYGERQDFLIASPEKALVDCLYLGSRRGKRFRFFPELDMGGDFRFGKAKAWIGRIPDPRIRKHVRDGLDSLRS